jgi:hypothetical protein
MNLRTWSNRDRPLALAVTAVLAIAAACSISDLTEPGQHHLGDGADMSLDLALAGGVPRGPLRLEGYRLFVDTVGQTDVFQRAGADGYYSLANLRYLMHTGVRIAGQDPRLPALAPIYAPEEFSIEFAYLWGPERYGDHIDIWDFYMRWYGFEFGKTYTYSIERLATIVNGSLDALEFIIEGEVTEPDQLLPLDGTPGGYPDNDYYWTTRAGCAAEPIPEPPPNPWYLGTVTAVSDGRLTADFCMGTPWLWYDGVVNVPDSSIAMPNELRRGPVPQYNYVVVYEGEPPNLGPPVLRIQMGVDLDTNGNPLPNGFAPFPVAADRQAAATLPQVEIEPTRIRLEIQDLEPLDGAYYELWLVNQEDASCTPATADHFTIETIVVTNELGQRNEVDVPSQDTVRTSAFHGRPEANIRHAFIVSNGTLAGPTIGDFTHVTLAKPGTSGALTDPVMWAQYLDHSGTPEDRSDDIFTHTDDLVLGALDPTSPPRSRTFRETGLGEGLVLCQASRPVHNDDGRAVGERCLDGRSSLNLHFQRLRRPPPGYVYEVWLLGDSLEPLSLGTITGPKPWCECIDDADMVVHDDFMTRTEILQATKVVPIDIPDLSQYTGVLVTLEPKAGVATMGPTKILSGALPEVCSVWMCSN